MKIKFSEDYKRADYFFESVGEIVSYADRSPKTHHATSREIGQWSWFGTNTFDEAVSLVRRGWQEGAEKVASILSGIADRISAILPAPGVVHDVSGSWVDVGRYVEGVPESMAELAPEACETQRGHKVVCVEVVVGVTAGIEGVTLIRRGAMVAALIEALETVGYSVEVVASSLTRASGGGKRAIRIVVKRSTEPIDLCELAFAVAHPSFYRRFCFGAIERATPLEKWHFYNLGYGENYGVSLYQPIVDGSDISLNAPKKNEEIPENRDEQVAWVVEKLKEFGINFEG